MNGDLHNVEPRRFAFQGIVISAIRDGESEQNNLVLLLRSREDNVANDRKIYGVLTVAFVPPTMDNDFLHVELAKNLERKFSKPLVFGDIIQWNESQCNHAKKTILGFRRERPIYGVSSNSAGPMVRVGGVIEPSKPTIFWTSIGEVSIPIKEATRAEPDCFLYAWIRFETNMRNSADVLDFTMIFDHFDGFDADEQSRVCEAPWHRKSPFSKFSVWMAEPTPCESDDEIDVEPPAGLVEAENKWAEKIRKQLGLFVGERLLVCKDLAQYDFIIPLLTPMQYSSEDTTLIYPSAGEYFYFSAVWSHIHRSFLVTDMMPVYFLRSHQTTPSGNICVRAMLSNVKGFLTDHESQLGLIDDANQVIPFFEFQLLSYDKLRANVEIRAIRATENRSVRYRVIRLVPDDESFDRYEDLKERSVIPFGPLDGMLINRDTVLCANYPNIYFRLPTNQNVNLPPGTGVHFRALRSLEFEKEATITEYYANTAHSAVNVYRNGDVTIFQLRLKAIADHVQLAENKSVGPIDLRSFDHPNDKKEEYLAWVRESPFVGDSRQASTILEVISLSPNPPILPHDAANLTRNSMYSRNSSRLSTGSNYASSNGKGSAASVSSGFSLSSTRFVGPKVNSESGRSHFSRSHSSQSYRHSSAASSQK